MTGLTYCVALPFLRDEEGHIVAGEPREARSAEHAARSAHMLATATRKRGAIAFSRSRDPATGDFYDTIGLKSVGGLAALVGA